MADISERPEEAGLSRNLWARWKVWIGYDDPRWSKVKSRCHAGLLINIQRFDYVIYIWSSAQWKEFIHVHVQTFQAYIQSKDTACLHEQLIKFSFGFCWKIITSDQVKSVFPMSRSRERAPYETQRKKSTQNGKIRTLKWRKTAYRHHSNLLEY